MIISYSCRSELNILLSSHEKQNMVLILPKSETDKNGLMRRNVKLVSSIGCSTMQANTEKYVGNLINYSTDYLWCSESISNSYFYINFVKPIFITNYTLETFDWGIKNHYPQAWEGIGTLDNQAQTIAKVSNSGISQAQQVKTFKTLTTGPFNYIKFTQIGKTPIDGYHFCLAKFEIFGFFENDVYHRSKCVIRHKQSKLFIAVILMS